MATSAVVLVGWAIDSTALKSVVPGMTSMKVNTALGLTLLAAALFGLDGRPTHWRAFVWGCLVAVAVLSLLTLAEYAFGVDLRIDDLVFHDRDSPRFPGRNAPATDVAFVGLATAYGLLRLRRRVMTAQVLLLVVAAAPIATLGGYLYGVPGLYRNAPYPAVALNTAVLLALLCLGGLFARPGDALMGVVTSDTLAGSVARKLLPAAAVVPLATGMVVLLGERAGLYLPAFGSALLVACCTVFFAGAVCWTVKLLWRAEATAAAAERARARTERKLGEGEDRLRVALEAGRLGTWELDLATRGVECSDRYKANFGLGPTDPCGQATLIGRVHAEDRERVTAALQQAVAERTEYRAEYRVVWPDGSVHWVGASGRGLYDDAGIPRRVVGVSVDRTPAKAAEAERERLLVAEREARAGAERANRLKDEFLATLSHELRTPLNAILGWSQVMQQSSDPDDLAQGLDVVVRNARAQAQIIEDLLDMSRIIGGKVRLDVQRLDLTAVVRAAVETARPTADAKGVRVQPVLDPLHGVVVTGDASRLQQVLWNLLSNAVKFTPKGGRVQVLLERVNSHLEISVIDTGQGIPPEFLPYVFDRFRQADNSITRRHGGLGLGLSIVKQLVELHGGSVRVKSAGEGHGATFVVALPLTVVHPEPGPEVDRRHPRLADPTNGTAAVTVDVGGVRVLVIDDEPDARALVKRLLEDRHAVVTATGSADEVVRLVATRQFDVLVSDIGMPREDGYALIKRVRALGKDGGGDIPAIALTAYARAEDRVKAVAAGFIMHVAKPVEPVELVAMVAGAAGRTGR